MDNSDFGVNLDDALRRKGWSHRDAAEFIGVDERQIYRWIANGLKKPHKRTKERLEALCAALGIKYESLWQPDYVGQHVAKLRESIGIWHRWRCRWANPLTELNKLHQHLTFLDKWVEEEEKEEEGTWQSINIVRADGVPPKNREEHKAETFWLLFEKLQQWDVGEIEARKRLAALLDGPKLFEEMDERLEAAKQPPEPADDLELFGKSKEAYRPSFAKDMMDRLERDHPAEYKALIAGTNRENLEVEVAELLETMAYGHARERLHNSAEAELFVDKLERDDPKEYEAFLAFCKGGRRSLSALVAELLETMSPEDARENLHEQAKIAGDPEVIAERMVDELEKEHPEEYKALLAHAKGDRELLPARLAALMETMTPEDVERTLYNAAEDALKQNQELADATEEEQPASGAIPDDPEVTAERMVSELEKDHPEEYKALLAHVRGNREMMSARLAALMETMTPEDAERTLYNAAEHTLKKNQELADATEEEPPEPPASEEIEEPPAEPPASEEEPPNTEGIPDDPDGFVKWMQEHRAQLWSSMVADMGEGAAEEMVKAALEDASGAKVLEAFKV